jgi:hypothetical protein
MRKYAHLAFTHIFFTAKQNKYQSINRDHYG